MKEEIEELEKKFDSFQVPDNRLDSFTKSAQDIAIIATSAFQGELLVKALDISIAIIEFAHELEIQEV